MKNVAKLLVIVGLVGQITACTSYGTSSFDSNRGYFNINGATSNPQISNAISVSMDSFDQERLGHALSTIRNEQPYAWQNPVTGNNYKLIVQRTYVNDLGLPCRYYFFNATLRGQPMTVRSTACRSGGTWQMTSQEGIY